MAILVGSALIVLVFLTSLLSGIFGMAGGLILLWILLLFLPVGTAIAVHGVIQIVSNFSRAWISRFHIDLAITLRIMAGVLIAAALFFWLRYTPEPGLVMLVVGVVPLLLWVPPTWLQLDASHPVQAVLCGLISGSLTVGVGVSGPMVDMFFIRTPVDRRRIVATKAAVQVLSHAVKVLFYWDSAFALSGVEWVTVLVAAPFTVAGTLTGARILTRMSDARFRMLARLLITAIGVSFLVRGVITLS